MVFKVPFLEAHFLHVRKRKAKEGGKVANAGFVQITSCQSLTIRQL